MRIHIIACEVFSRELTALCAECENTITLSLLPQGLHDTPDILRKKLQAQIDLCAGVSVKHQPDAIALCYGQCSNGVCGLNAEKVPLVVPRYDDCIGIFLGSEERYLAHFNQSGGTYWLTPGWVEHAFLPTKDNREKRYREYLERYGKENADYLNEEQWRWTGEYKACRYIKSPLLKERGWDKTAETIASLYGWEYAELSGSAYLLQNLVSGRWEKGNFLVCPPGYRIAPSFDERKLIAVPI